MYTLKKYQIFLLFFLIAVTFLVFIPMINANFSPLDDGRMLKVNNKALPDISLKSIIIIFKSYNEGLYHPMTTISYKIEKNLFGFVPEIFHFDNILLHISNIILVFLIFFKLSKSFWLSFIITSLFAIHPTRAEVVCWVSARKDLLYTFFYLLSILLYIKMYDHKKATIYITLSVIMFLFSCFSKAMAITLPFVLILIDFYTNNFKKQKIKIYFIYILITFIFIIATIQTHYFTKYHFTEINNIDFIFNFFNLTINFINAHFNILFYLEKLILPINLRCAYPYLYNKSSMPPLYILYSPAIVYILIYFCFLSLRKTKIFFYGFAFFIITILPSNNILPIENFDVANRYTYIPYLGLFFIFAKIIVYLLNKTRKYTKIPIIIFCLIIFITLSYLLYHEVIGWQLHSFTFK